MRHCNGAKGCVSHGFSEQDALRKIFCCILLVNDLCAHLTNQRVAVRLRAAQEKVTVKVRKKCF